MCLSFSTFVACSSGSGASPGSTAGNWTGTESCNGWTLSSAAGAPAEVPLPSTMMMNASASVVQNDGGLAITGLTVGPLAGWSCPDQTLNSDGVSDLSFASSPAPCSMPTDAGDVTFDFTVSGDTYSSDGHNTLFLSFALSAPSTAEAPDISTVGSCTIYLTQP